MTRVVPMLELYLDANLKITLQIHSYRHVVIHKIEDKFRIVDSKKTFCFQILDFIISFHWFSIIVF